jgi:hypothetical protein
MKSGIGHLVRSRLLEGEWSLWSRMDPVDQRHSIAVANRYCALRPEAGREEIAAVLLHDVGKIVAGVGTTQRVLATLLGPRTERWRQYLAHEELGVDLCRTAGSAEITLAILTDPEHPLARILRRADDI